MTTTTSVADHSGIGWSSRFMFILAAAGSAVGLGNIWKFPYIVGEHGGGAFVLLYLLCLTVLGLPVLIAEIMVGRSGSEHPARAYAAVAAVAQLSGRWRLLGSVGALTALIVLSFYTVVTGWVLVYAVDYARALFEPAALPSGLAEVRFADLTRDIGVQLTAFAATVIAALLFVARRATRGIELAMTWMAPLFVALVIALALFAYRIHPAPLDILSYLFKPDFSALTPAAFSEALGHAFFTLSIGMCGMLVYGAYLNRPTAIPRLAVSVAAIDTAVALVCVFIVMGMGMAAGADPAQGPGLIFVVLPHAFASMPASNIVGAAFFLTVFVAALSSIVAIMVVVTRAAEEVFAIDTALAAAGCAAAILFGGTCVVAANSGVLPVEILGMPLFDALDTLASSILLPLGGIGTAVFAGRAFASELSATAMGRYVLFCLRWIAPAALLALAVLRLS
jgi:NSS family neurotransmitter:Na+ symporter